MLFRSSVIFCWLRKELKRYKIYLICGAKRIQIAALLSWHIGFLVTIAYGAAFLIALVLSGVTPREIFMPLPWTFYIVIYAASLLLIQIAVHIKALPVVFRGKLL